MTDNSDEAWLIGLANDVCDGKPVDWERVVPPGAAAESQQMVAELRRLATVVDAHRTLGEEAPAPAPSPDPITTSGVWGPLVLLETVGHGAFGTVYRAWDAQLDREVALKVLLQVPLESPLEEARHLARIRHPNVVSVYGAERVDEQVGIWMEFIEGETLGTVVGERGPMSAREVAGIGIDLCRALSALHRSDLVHGDIKAQNVMREVGGRIVLMDFSGVRAPDAHAAPEFSGTPPYIAPELFEGRGASFGADIYSLGVLLFYLLSGHFPVDGEDVAEIRRRHASGERVRLRDIRPELPDAVVEIVERATAVDRGERFRTAGDLEHALMGIFAGHGASSGAGSARAGARGVACGMGSRRRGRDCTRGKYCRVALRAARSVCRPDPSSGSGSARLTTPVRGRVWLRTAARSCSGRPSTAARSCGCTRSVRARGMRSRRPRLRRPRSGRPIRVGSGSSATGS